MKSIFVFGIAVLNITYSKANRDVVELQTKIQFGNGPNVRRNWIYEFLLSKYSLKKYDKACQQGYHWTPSGCKFLQVKFLTKYLYSEDTVDGGGNPDVDNRPKSCTEGAIRLTNGKCRQLQQDAPSDDDYDSENSNKRTKEL